ncbi:putative membrane protein [Propionispora sp. 2/2-37]|uniref:hypothetical protein n=1 Tax=Propionispora sp. 2/2-37 TaxID=1677858 RepID=UPI0006BB7DA5|nr:hypothetical protein [Propionispora sp. 2/2-37]CUH97296.1 putative membrane protein [Propionispora sp. 2/2-37]
MNTALDAARRLKELLAGTDKTTQTILRIAAAVFGGYVLTSSFLAALALLLTWPKAEVFFFSMLFPALVYPAAVLWAFAAPSAQRAWRDLLAASLLFSMLALLAAWVN